MLGWRIFSFSDFHPSVPAATSSLVFSPSVSVCPFLCHSILIHRAHSFGLVSLVSTEKLTNNDSLRQHVHLKCHLAL